MTQTAPPTAAPTTRRLACACGHEIEIPTARVGDSVTCPECRVVRVVIRSKVTGDVPPAVQAGALSREERREVDETLRRIKLRRVGRATRHVDLYPSWAVFVAGVQFYLSAILAGENLKALGDERRGKRVQLLGVGGYVVLGAGLLASTLRWGDQVPFGALLAVLLAIPLAFAVYFTSIQHQAGVAAREAGAQDASVVPPLLMGVILAVAQAFAVWFLKIKIEGPWSS